ncbi:type VII secretion target [Candidatus Mycolicibacterium alkanivorans]|uniref:ESX-1 secretion-associated protein n=1 Tax=Candidatus Mycolicibacterium alkanivorans TaxID=2954114 RepID=A0ABS9Z0T6_9MYCO|nr:type VII secretion target [Candidatus Mycolicibacterium alkanivorans]MCI4676937.1 ESX-1 secretion-associated protein [Candidatus Mycolicibacterium alkanivorans]
MGNTRVDTAAVRAAAQRFDAVAQILDSALRNHLGEPAFGGSKAGRAHTARGEAVGMALRRIGAELAQWSRAAEEIGAALRAGADRYADAEWRAAAVLG